jgi:cyclic beta-1,2-glucan synthetase
LATEKTLFNVELYNYARELALQHQTIGTSKRATLKRKLNGEVKKLNRFYDEYRSDLKAKLNIPSAGEWLIDNLYLINEQAAFVCRNFPSSYYTRLPVLTSGPARGTRRIYAIIVALLDYSGGHCDLKSLVNFLEAYQEIQPLTMGELWAVPLLLRAAIINKLSRIFEEINDRALPKNQVKVFVKHVIPFLKINVSDKIHYIISGIEKRLDLTNPLVLVHLTHYLREHIESMPLLRWLEARTATQKISLPRLVEQESAKQAQYRVTVGQLFTSLHEITSTIWEHYFEDLSLVEKYLRQDPAEVYPKMDFASRDFTRHILEKIAKSWRLPEVAIAQQVLSLANKATASKDSILEKHVGYYLISSGRKELAASFGQQSRIWYHPREKLTEKPNAVYFSALFLLIALFLSSFCLLLGSLQLFNAWQLLLISILLIMPAGEWSLRHLHWILTYIFPPCFLPKLEFRDGVPSEHSTIVVIPTLLSSPATARELIHRLEIYHLANPDPHIYFALLTDFTDAPQEEMPQDAAIIDAALKGIAELNTRYPHPSASFFSLLHRRRQWNPAEQKWMGWERKRGKLMEFNALVMGNDNTSFNVFSGDLSILKTIRYVITLDADTQLPRDAAIRLIGAMAHPLNNPVLNEKKNKVIRGYGLLQPRIGISNESINQSFFALLFGGKAGIDVYSSAVSDPYQDLFQHGIFTGKGIYDVKILHHILYKRIPENSVLSHDLLEGGFVNSGLVTDIELIDDFPSNYLSSLSRTHRWVRGDWQLIPWLATRTPNQKGKKVPVRLPLVTRWQMIDNMRRSLHGPVLYSLIWIGIAAFTMKPPLLNIPLLFILLISSINFLSNLAQGIRNGTGLHEYFARAVFNFLVLPYHSIVMLDAIVRTLYRMLFSRKRLLEWVTAADETKRAPKTLLGFWKRMLKGQLLVIGSGALLWLTAPQATVLTIIVTVFWLTAPVVVYYTSLPMRRHSARLNEDDLIYLRNIGRRTWHFFETTVSAGEHWLPPDNLQVDPPNGIAHRTSPTNIGLYLASIINARDFGYITTSKMLDRIEGTLNTLQELPRWQGHFYNWYDTVSLAPLAPLYVSTVDSGNLVAYLITVRQSVAEYLERSLADSHLIQGLLDTVCWELFDNHEFEDQIEEIIHVLKNELNRPFSLTRWYQVLKELAGVLGNTVHCSKAIQSQLQEFDLLFGWLLGLDKIQNPDMVSQLSVLYGLEAAPAGMKAERIISLSEIINISEGLLIAVSDIIPQNNDDMFARFFECLVNSHAQADKMRQRGKQLLKQFDALIHDHNFSSLYDIKRRLFAIGYNVTTKQLDSSYYNLLASEARQASFVAIALGQIPTQHWFAMGRTMSLVHGSPTLISWSGTMFEYLMPLLLMPVYSNTLWEKTYEVVVKRQISYARKLNMPWGISESGYNAHDFNLNYQYRAFGVPGLGLKQGLENDRVIAPYATVLAAMVLPRQALTNLQALENYEALAEYGFYEALDFTPDRLPPSTRYVTIKSHMAHHQGMIFLSIGNLVFNNQMHRRFMSDPQIEAAEPLLREKAPVRPITIASKAPQLIAVRAKHTEGSDLKQYYSIDTILPEARFLSNGNYQVMVSNNGGGFSRWGKLYLTRWNEDPVQNASGSFFYIRNLNDNQHWSPTYLPCRITADDAAMSYSLEKIRFTRTDGPIHTSLEIFVSHEFDAELRLFKFSNHGDTPCTLEITSLLEPVLATGEEFHAHPVYNRMFLETEAVPQENALLAHRRTDSPANNNPWLIHAMNADDSIIGALEYETDRSRFWGFERALNLPLAVQANHNLSGTTGTVIDPVLSLRRRIHLEPGKSGRLLFITGIASTREQALEISQKLRYPFQWFRVIDLTWTHVRLELKNLNYTPQQVNLFQWMASQIFYFNPYRQKRVDNVLKNTKGQSALWRYGISGDLPIVLLTISNMDGMELASTMLQAYNYWRLKGMAIDLLILDASGNDGYEKPLQDALQGMIENYRSCIESNQPGCIYLYSKTAISDEDQVLLETVAHLSLRSGEENLINQLQPVSDQSSLPPKRLIMTPSGVTANLIPVEPPQNLLFFNDWGGFTPSWREYVIYLKNRDFVPAPWVNIIANPKFGFQISESGGGYTWAENSREYKITPWSNDPVFDTPGEICYFRDEETGMVWSQSACPIRDAEPYTVRHGQGYSIFNHYSQGLEQTALLFVPMSDPVKIVQIQLENTAENARRLAVTYYLEWVLGVERHKTAPYIVTEFDPETEALLARNIYQENFPGRFGFLYIGSDQPVKERSWTGDRAEFIGRNGCLSNPSGLEQVSLSKRTGAHYNPCGAMQVKVAIPPKSKITVTILLGSASSLEEARSCIRKYTPVTHIKKAYQGVTQFWDDLLNKVEITTPDCALNILANRWLLYQVLACRIWARSAFYQSGGAYGFRDQLQDSLSLLHTRPDLVRSQLLLHAAHQFREGDVQHWWHTETGFGIRTRFSDDLLWLPYAACRYVQHTGDESIWEEIIPFLEAPPLSDDEMEKYGPTIVSGESGTLYEHCLRAIDHSLQIGAHHLPLMGCGDWNDGMNRIGREGRGESVWLGYFLYVVLESIIPACISRQADSIAVQYKTIAEQLALALENEAWDGQWYRRAFNDDGTALGSIKNPECQIDCIVQAWAAISGATSPERARTAMESVNQKLVSREHLLVKLLTPPFNNTTPSPGYIQAYPPGVRENGAQYTHGAVWAAMAWAKLGEGNRAYELINMLNPVNHARTHQEVQRYRVEPYVMAADVYSTPHLAGRGGWTWYTGSAGWMYQAVLEWILGITRRGDSLYINPCIPEHWQDYSVTYHFGGATYQIGVKNPSRKQTGRSELRLDGNALDPEEGRIPLIDDGQVHRVEIVM